MVCRNKLAYKHGFLMYVYLLFWQAWIVVDMEVRWRVQSVQIVGHTIP